MYLNAENLIYVYLFICIALLFFNIFYIFCSKRRQRGQEKKAEKWEKMIREQIVSLTRGEHISEEHQRQMKREFVRTDSLVSYGNALDRISVKEPAMVDEYIFACQETIQFLASRYRKKDSMDQAYFAYLISRHYPCCYNEYNPLMELLISFLHGSSVYCKENVLKALYALGNCEAVETALQLFNDQQWFHHPKLLSDGLLTYKGDKEELADRLWSHYRQWNQEIMLSVIRFITGFTESYREVFFSLLIEEDTELEIKLSVFRYYRKYPYEPVRPLLIKELLDENSDDSPKIVAASVLSSFPGEETTAALKQALHHPNWYVRYNAAASLAQLKTQPWELQDIFTGEDQYAKEILEYMLEDVKAGG